MQKPTIGFVPTMGFLHEGHASLIKRARSLDDVVIVSIFVNPLQFGPNEDYNRYPREIEQDEKLCEGLGVDLIFAPTALEMYGADGCETSIHVAYLGDHLCGASRPGHFDGVCTVVAKLFQIVTPDRAYFGKKDAQQWRIVRRMVKDLSMPVEIVPCEIVREEDGLAKSSRNVYLSPEERQEAVHLRKTLLLIQDAAIKGQRDVKQLKSLALAYLADHPLVALDYLELVDGDTLQPCAAIRGEAPTLCAIAAYVGKTRLIDNIELELRA